MNPVPVVIGLSLVLAFFALWSYCVETFHRWRNFRREGRRLTLRSLLEIFGPEREVRPGHFVKPAHSTLRERHLHEVELRRRTWSEGRPNDPPVPHPRKPDV